MSRFTYIIPGWWPWATACFVITAAVCAWYCLRHSNGSLKRNTHFAIWALRFLAGLLILACIVDFREERSRESKERPLLHVLIDKSASMAVNDAPAGKSRFAAANDLLDSSVRPVWKDDARLQLDFAGDGLVAAAKPSAAQADAMRSSLGRALRETIDASRDEALGGVILFTDGAASDPDEVRAATRMFADANVPVFPWVIGKPEQPADVRIVSAKLRQPSPSRAEIHLDLTVDSPGFTDRSTKLTVRFQDQVLYQKTVRLNGGSQQIAANFISPHLGCQFYDIALEPVDGELVKENNATRAACELLRNQIRVLYMEGSKPAETAFLKDALESDPEMSVTCLHFPGEQSLEELTAQALAVRGKDGRVFYDRVGREVPSVCHPTRGYPATMVDLLKYDVVIDSDIIKEAFTPEQLANTVDFVEKFGGGFVMVGGQTSFGAGGYETTVIDKLMPIEIANKSDMIWERFGVELTQAGKHHPMMQVGADEAETRDAWTRRFPGFEGINYARRAKPGAHVIAQVNAPGLDINELVLFAVQDIGRGRTFAFMSDTTEGWGTAFERFWGVPTASGQRNAFGSGSNPRISYGSNNNQYFSKFWNNTIRWLAEERIARKTGLAAIELPGTRIVPGDVLPLRIMTASAGDLTRLEVSLHQQGQDRIVVPVQWNGAHHCWEGSFVPKTTGDVTLEASYRNAEGDPSTTRSGICVYPASDEKIAVAAQTALMEELAQETGGTVLNAQNFKDVLQQLGSNTTAVIWKRSLPVWDKWWLLLPLIAIVTLEWLLRRKRKPQQAN